MAYRVKLMDRALSDLAYLYAWVGAESSEAAAQWYNGLEDAIYSSEEQPARCPLTPESNKYRHLLYGRKPHIYRLIYRVLEKQKQVEILHIRHGAMRAFEIERLM
ncbi:MAG TPA: type II toxin-antitoxin system RelE/ParE family toxin [Bryobacteraceae bacterium]